MKTQKLYFLYADQNFAIKSSGQRCDAQKLKSTVPITSTGSRLSLQWLGSFWTEALYKVQDEHVSQSGSDIKLDLLRGLNYMIHPIMSYAGSLPVLKH